MRGRILKGIGSFYSVAGEDGALYTARPCGHLREIRMTPEVGDIVDFAPAPCDGSYINAIEPRKNIMKRPVITNIDMLVWVLSAEKPEADLLLLDKMLIYAARMGILCVIAINKCDIATPQSIENIRTQYAHSGGKCLSVSAVSGQGLDELSACMHGVTCFAGQSGGGKSSLLAKLTQGEFESGELSRKTGRGKHTTRHSELIAYKGGFVADTPGFSLLDMESIDPRELAGCYEEFTPYARQCRFSSCSHTSEPMCAVTEAVSKGFIDGGRYKRYTELFSQMKSNWRKRYD